MRRVLAVVSTFALLSACHRQASVGSQANGAMTPSGVVVVQDGPTALPASNNHAAARLAASPRKSEWVKIAWEPGSTDSLMAWVVYPNNARGKAPVVVVVHEIFGLSTGVRALADQVAAEGFIAVAPDLVSRARGGPSMVELPDSTASRLIRGVAI